MSARTINIILLAFVITTWGYSWVLMKMGLEYSGPITFAAWRCGIAAVAMLAYVIIKSKKWPKLQRLPDYAAVGLFQTTFMFAFMLNGMKHVSAGKTSVLLYTMPIWTMLILHFYLRDRLSRPQWTGVLLGTVGVLCILGWDTITHQNMQKLIGEFLILIGAISWAVSNIWVKKRMARDDVFMISALQLLIGAIGLFLIAIPSEGILNIEWNAHSIYILLFTGLIASAVDFTIWFYLLKNLDIGITTFSSMMVPVFGLFFDRIILGSRLDIGIIVGSLLILAGIYNVSRYNISSSNVLKSTPNK